MDQTTAVRILIQGVTIAQKSGIYTLKEAELLSKAISAFTTEYQSRIPDDDKIENKN
jgi:hypothetical protein